MSAPSHAASASVALHEQRPMGYEEKNDDLSKHVETEVTEIEMKQDVCNGDESQLVDDDVAEETKQLHNSVVKKLEANRVRTEKLAHLSFGEVHKMLEQYSQTLDERRNGTIHPDDNFMKYWDFVILLFLIFTATVTPFEVAFLDTHFDGMFVTNRVVDFTFIIDIVVNFRLAYSDNRGWIYEKRQIACRYARSWFVIDFISVIPFDIVGLVYESDSVDSLKIIRLLKLLRLIKLMRVFRASRILARWEAKMNLSYAMLSLYKFAVATAAIIHWGACAWALAPALDPDAQSWLDAYQLENSPHHTQYLAAVYWSTMTATTIGYGDIGPQSNGERLVAIFLMLVGAMVYALIVGSICGIVASMDKATTKYHQTMDNLNRYMEEEQAPAQMRQKLRRYFMHCRDIHRNEERHEVLRLMSPGLRGEFTEHSHSAWIHTLSFLSNIPPVERRSLGVRISMKLTMESFPPGESIVEPGSHASKLYIVKSGLVARLGRILAAGKYFGEDVVLHKGRRGYFVNTLTYVNCLILHKHDLDRILRGGDFYHSRKVIRKFAIKLALRRAFVDYASAYYVWQLNHPDEDISVFRAGLGSRVLRRQSVNPLDEATHVKRALLASTVASLHPEEDKHDAIIGKDMINVAKRWEQRVLETDAPQHDAPTTEHDLRVIERHERHMRHQMERRVENYNDHFLAEEGEDIFPETTKYLDQQFDSILKVFSDVQGRLDAIGKAQDALESEQLRFGQHQEEQWNTFVNHYQATHHGSDFSHLYQSPTTDGTAEGVGYPAAANSGETGARTTVRANKSSLLI